MDLPSALTSYAHIIKVNEPLSHYSYMKVGGIADYVAVVNNTQDLLSLVQISQINHLRFYILGGGSNVIFTDQGFRGLIIINRSSHMTIDPQTNVLTVDSGAIMNAVVNYSISLGYSGIHTFLGIPGSVGGAVYNNAHYFQKLIGDKIISAELVDSKGKCKWVSQDYFQFKYDYSILHQTKETLLLVKILLEESSVDLVKQEALNALMKRRKSQPLEMASSGCFFQNPPDQFAGALIDQAGLKGYKVGGAEVSPVHANFIVNSGTASAQDVIDLSGKIVEMVRLKSGITLQQEVVIVDETGERIAI